MKELEDDYGFIEAINLKVVKNDVFRKRSFESIYQFSVYRNLLYYMLRITKPKIVVETGVLHGLTSAWMLKAISKNNFGKLISIDLPRRDWDEHFPETEMGPGNEYDMDLPIDELPGWMIPDELRNNWELLLGPSTHYLKNVCIENDVDIFVHDSDHSEENVKFECETVFENHPDVYMVIDNFDWNDYFFKYIVEESPHHMFMDEVNDSLEISTCTGFCKQKRK
jgi:hypothetical protein